MSSGIVYHYRIGLGPASCLGGSTLEGGMKNGDLHTDLLEISRIRRRSLRTPYDDVADRGGKSDSQRFGNGGTLLHM